MFFIGMETAYTAADRLRFAIASKEKVPSSYLLSVFYDNPLQFTATIFVGKYTSIVLYCILLAHLPLDDTTDHLFSILIRISIGTLILVIATEYIPKTLCKINPNLWLQSSSWVLFLFYILFYPVIWICSWITVRFFRLFRIKLPTETSKNLFSAINSNLTIKEKQKEESNEKKNDITIFQNALDFSKIKLRDCLIPRTEMIALAYKTEVNVLKQTFVETGLSKILVYQEDIDNIIGYIHSSEMYLHQNNWQEHIRDIPIVPETMAAQKLMKIFMQKKKSIAVVVDEFGGTAGIITLEDIIEEIFGDIEDEHDYKEYIAQKTSNNEYLFSGRLEVEEANKLFDLNLQTSEAYTTIAGYILNSTQHFPKLNEVIKIEKYTFKCIKVTNNKIELVRMEVNN